MIISLTWTPEELRALAEADKRPAHRFLDSIAGADTDIYQMLTRREVLALALMTFADEPACQRAADFWGGVARDDGLKHLDPRKTCIRFMQKTPPSGAGLGDLARGVSRCWNAWFRDEPDLKYVRPGDNDVPIYLAGTRLKYLHPSDRGIDRAAADEGEGLSA